MSPRALSRGRGYLEDEVKTAADLIQEHIDKPLVIARTEELASHAIDRMRRFKISQIPVVDINGFAGSLSDTDLFQAYLENPAIAEKPIREIMGATYPIVKANASIEEVSKLITKENQAVLVELEGGKYHIITKYDIINSIK